jgi:hypothetical protein
MKRHIGRGLVVLAVLTMLFNGGVTAGVAIADVLTFDDVSTTSSVVTIPNGYGGFDWGNFFVIKDTFHPGSGYDKGTVSGDYTAFNGYGNQSLVRNGVFDFNSTYLTAAWNNGLGITAEGLSGGSLLYSSTVTVDTTGPTLFTFNFVGIDELRFTSFGGTNAGLGGGGTHFVMDNFTFNEVAQNPEPSTWMLLSTGLVGLLGYGWRRKQREVA